jgi:hypothetical protein
MASHRLPSRQAQLLELIAELGGSIGNLDLQKLLFLYCQQPDVGPIYEFVPYRYGAFSFTSYADRRKLLEHGLLEDDEKRWTLTEDGWSATVGGRNLFALAFVRNHGLRGDALIAATYRAFPYYATRSEIAEDLLSGENAAIQRITTARPAKHGSGLATIGYEGRSLEGYLNTLIKAGVDLLCDVRKNPISRKYGFSKTTLGNACEKVGIQYEHLPELGVPSSQRRELQTQEDYDSLFEWYEDVVLSKQQSALTSIETWVVSGRYVALTCYENCPERCHRGRVAGALSTQLELPEGLGRL